MKVELKRLTENELEMLMNWRMREDISKGMFNTVKLTLEGQKAWFEKIKNDNTQIRWIIYCDGVPVGSMYLTDIDYNNKRCESGWFVAEKEYRSLKLAMALQQNMYDYVFDTLKLNKIYGYILDNNKMVLRLVKTCGIEEEGLLKKHILKNGIFHDVYVVGLTSENWKNKKSNYHYDKFNIE